MAWKLRVEPYDPDAIDADNDGIVQEGTAWERPAGTRLLDEIGNEIQRGLTSNARPSMRVVDPSGVDIDYKPSYGTRAPKGAKRTTLGSLGYPSLSERGSVPLTSLQDRGVASLDSMVPTIEGIITPSEPEETNIDDQIYAVVRKIDPDRRVPKRGNRERAFKRADEKAKELSWSSGSHYLVETDSDFLVLSQLEHDQFIESLGGNVPDSVTISQYVKPKPEVNLDDAKDIVDNFAGPKVTEIDDALYRQHAASLHFLGGAPEDVPDEVFAAAVFDEGIVDSLDSPLVNLDGNELTFEDIMTGNFAEGVITDGTEFSNRRFDFKALKGNHGDAYGHGGLWTVFKVTDKQTGETWYVKSSTYGQHEGLLESVGMEIASELGFASAGGQTDIKTSTPIKVVEEPEFYKARGDRTNRVSRWTAMRSIDSWKTDTQLQPQVDLDGNTDTWLDAGKAQRGLDQSLVDPTDMANILVFDFVLDNLDRHPGNFKVATDQLGYQRLGIIDNGLLFGGRIRDFPDFMSLTHDEEATPEQLLEHAQDRAGLTMADYATGDIGTVLISSLGGFGNRMERDIIGRERETFDKAMQDAVEKMEASVERILSVSRFNERGIKLTPTEEAHLEGMRIVAMARLKHLKENPNAFYEAIQELQNVAARRQQAGMGMSGRPRRRPAPPPASREITPAQGFY